MDWSDVTEYRPVNDDIIPNNNHEDNTLLLSNQETEKVLLNPIVDKFISTDPQPREIENNEVIIAHDDSQLQNNNVYLTFKAQDSGHFCGAKQAELEKWRQYNVYNQIKIVGQKRLTGRLVGTRKIDNNITQLKARYIIKGFQEKLSIQSDSPTGSKKCLQIIFAIVSRKQWLLNSIDINSAFL